MIEFRFQVGAPVVIDDEEKWTAPALLDDDLVLGDCDSDDEVHCPASCSSGRTTARRLMQGRAQQCIVCMEEKESWRSLMTPVRPLCEI
eukprot:g16810.t1